ncbi:putative MFS peptide transporter [Pyronema domesticum]|nr:putative MFS peptide transporter [Pyronema domesticum]
MTTVLPEETENKDPITVSAEEKETTVIQDPVEDGNLAIVFTEEKDVVPDTAEDKEPVNEAAEDAAEPIRNPDEPTAEEFVTLPRVPGTLSFVTLTIAIVETCERISFCGQIAVFQNFIQQSLPEGSPTGAGGHKGVSGALGLGQKVATSISTVDAFLIYAMPLLGGYLADTHWGRYKTITLAIFMYLLGNAILIVASSPPLLAMPKGALALLITAIVVQAMGTGSIKACTGTFMAEQTIKDRPKIKIKSGKRVIIDNELTVARSYQYFYMILNIGAVVGESIMVYAEKYVGFYLAFIIPLLFFCICPFIMLWGRKRYVRVKPTGSVHVKAWKTTRMAIRGQLSWNPVKAYRNLTNPAIWDSVKPSTIPLGARPKWMDFDDNWVDELRRGLKACTAFCFFPILWLGINQMLHNLTSQAATMNTHGIPNDFYSNINPVVLIITIPILDKVIYPQLRRWKINYSPLRRIFCGFLLATLALMWCAIIQWRIYVLSPCGYHANQCPTSQHAPISALWQAGPFALIALAEILAVTTGMEYCFKKAPPNMRSLAYSLCLLMTAMASVIGEAFIPLSDDPLLIYNYAVISGLLCVCTIAFGFMFYKQDKEERRAFKEGRTMIVLAEREVVGADKDQEK